MEQTFVQFHSLLKDELTYEVSIRSETPAPTVLGLKKQLKHLLTEIPSESILETDIPAETELEVVTQKLQDLKDLIKKFEENKERHTFCRAKALASHLYFRNLRILSSEVTVKSKKSELSSKLDILISRLEPNNDWGQENESLTSDSTTVECAGDKNVAKWKLTYNGQGDPRSFIERVEEYKKSYGVSDSKLFISAFHLFTGKALLWFRGNKSLVSNWLELKKLFLEEFDAVDYDHRLIGEIRARTQGPDEPVCIYFSVMFCMFARLSAPLSEEQKLSILLHNIRPCYSEQLALVTIDSVAVLKEKCRKLEAAKQRSALFSEPSSNKALLSSEFAYKSNSKQVNTVSATAVRVNRSESNNSVQSNRKLCYKCGKGNHNFKFCRVVPKSLRCFSCGLQNYTVKTCPVCSKKALVRQPLPNKNSKN